MGSVRLLRSLLKLLAKPGGGRILEKVLEGGRVGGQHLGQMSGLCELRPTVRVPSLLVLMPSDSRFTRPLFPVIEKAASFSSWIAKNAEKCRSLTDLRYWWWDRRCIAG